jgi:hypothetical protein
MTHERTLLSKNAMGVLAGTDWRTIRTDCLTSCPGLLSRSASVLQLRAAAAAAAACTACRCVQACPCIVVIKCGAMHFVCACNRQAATFHFKQICI